MTKLPDRENTIGRGKDGRRLSKRGNKKEIAERLRTVEQMLNRCVTVGSIQAMLSIRWGVRTRQIRVYIERIHAQWDADAKSLAIDRVTQRRAQFEALLEQAMLQTPPNLKAAVTILDRLCRVDGAYSEERASIVVSGAVGLRAMTSADKRKRLEELLGAHVATFGANGANGANGHGGNGRTN